MEEMKVKAANEVYARTDELFELKKKRSQLVRALFFNGECIFDNSDVQKLDNLIEQAKKEFEATVEDAIDTYKNFEVQNNSNH